MRAPDDHRLLRIQLDAPASAARGCLFCGAPNDPTRALDDCSRCGSPLKTVDHNREYSARMLRRVPRRDAIEIRVRWPQETPIHAEMRNLSLHGMAFASAMRFEINQVVRIDCAELRALARVAHVRDDAGVAHRFASGVEFLTVHYLKIRDSFDFDAP